MLLKNIEMKLVLIVLFFFAKKVLHRHTLYLFNK